MIVKQYVIKINYNIIKFFFCMMCIYMQCSTHSNIINYNFVNVETYMLLDLQYNS